MPNIKPVYRSGIKNINSEDKLGALVIALGFEPRTVCLEGRCSIQLSYATDMFRLSFVCDRSDEIGMLCPAELRDRYVFSLSFVCDRSDEVGMLYPAELCLFCLPCLPTGRRQACKRPVKKTLVNRMTYKGGCGETGIRTLATLSR